MSLTPYSASLLSYNFPLTQCHDALMMSYEPNFDIDEYIEAPLENLNPEKAARLTRVEIFHPVYGYTSVDVAFVQSVYGKLSQSQLEDLFCLIDSKDDIEALKDLVYGEFSHLSSNELYNALKKYLDKKFEKKFSLLMKNP